MSTFLEQLADKLLSSKTSLENQVVILPTKRSGIFLKRLIQEKKQGHFWLPKTLTLNQWVAEVASLQPVDPLKSIFTCYDAYLEVLKDRAQKLPEFMSWCPVLLADFNDIESQGIEAGHIFKELTDYTEIQYFSFLESPLSEKQKTYRDFWNSLKEIFDRFNKKLLAEKLAYPGLMLSEAQKKISTYLNSNSANYFVFAGFNALSQREAQLIQVISSQGRGDLYFDVDEYYLDTQNQAGYFIQNHLKKNHGSLIKTPLPLDKREAFIEICSAANHLDQANAVAAILEEVPADELGETAVILADETLLSPLIQRLPEKIKSVNVTMGLSLKDSLFADWLEKWIELHRKSKQKEGIFEASKSNLENLIRHPFSEYLGIEWELPKNISKVRLNPEVESSSLGKALLHPLLKGSAPDFNAFLKVLELTEKILIHKDKLSLEERMALSAVGKIRKTIERVMDFPNSGDLNLSAIQSIIFSALRSSSLSLLGEPIEGLQIMGVLESRALSFKRLIICSVNEDVLPKKDHIESFIPFEIRNFHRLPGKREKEAVYAYQFYRLLQHAQKFHAIYHVDSDHFKGGEPSRYLLQLEHELLPQAKGKIEFQKRTTALSSQVLNQPDPSIEKSEEVVAKILERLSNKGLSASAINRFFEDPLEWYYEYVLNLKTPETEEIDSATFGSIVHLSLENLFQPYVNNLISVPLMEKIIGKADQEVTKCFEAECAHLNIFYGVNRIHLETAKSMVRAYLVAEKKSIENGDEVYLLKLEERLKRSLNFNFNGKNIDIPFSGIADRIEKRNGVLRIADYKTGAVKENDLGLKGFTREDLSKKPKALQLAMYQWLIAQKSNEVCEAQIISLPAPGKRNLLLNLEFDEKKFEAAQTEILNEMLNHEIPLAKNPSFKYSIFE